MATPPELASRCRVAGKDCKHEIKYICMHCGKPVCDGPNCHIKIKDPLFQKLPDDVDKEAIHCPECAKMHQKAVIIRYFESMGKRIQKGLKEKTVQRIKKEASETEAAEEGEPNHDQEAETKSDEIRGE